MPIGQELQPRDICHVGVTDDTKVLALSPHTLSSSLPRSFSRLCHLTDGFQTTLSEVSIRGDTIGSKDLTHGRTVFQGRGEPGGL